MEDLVGSGGGHIVPAHGLDHELRAGLQKSQVYLLLSEWLKHPDVIVWKSSMRRARRPWKARAYLVVAVGLLGGLMRGPAASSPPSWWKAGYPRRVHRSVAEVELLSNLAVLLAPQESIEDLFRDFCVEPSEGWASSRLSPDLALPGVLKKKSAILFVEYDGYYRHHQPEGMEADERKNAALAHYAPAGSHIVRVAHAGRNFSQALDNVVEVVVDTWQSGSNRSILKCAYQIAQSLATRLSEVLHPAWKERLLEFSHGTRQLNLEAARNFSKKVVFSRSARRSENERHEILAFMQQHFCLGDMVVEKCPSLLGLSIEANLKPTVAWLHSVGLSDDQVSKAIAAHPQLLGCSIEANLKPTVEWLRSVGLSDDQVSKAIAAQPQLLGCSIEANLKPTVEWLRSVGLSDDQVSKAIAAQPQLLGCSIEANLKPTVEWLRSVGLSDDQVSKAIAAHPQLLGCSIEANLKPTVEWLHSVGLSDVQVSKAIAAHPQLLGCSIEANLKPTVEWLHSVGVSDDQVSKAIAAKPQLLGCSIEANLKPTVEWLHSVGLSDDQVSKAIAVFPSLLGLSIEANLKPTVEWLHSVGLSDDQVSKAIAVFPSLLGLSIEANLKPTVEWLRSVGLSDDQVSKAIAAKPQLLCYSIEANLKPTVEWLHSVGLSDDQVSKAIAAQPQLLGCSIEANLKPTVEWLRSVGLSDDQVSKAIAAHPQLLGYSIEKNLSRKLSILQRCYTDISLVDMISAFPTLLSYSQSRLVYRMGVLKVRGELPKLVSVIALTNSRFAQRFPT